MANLLIESKFKLGEFATWGRANGIPFLWKFSRRNIGSKAIVSSGVLKERAVKRLLIIRECDVTLVKLYLGDVKEITR